MSATYPVGTRVILPLDMGHDHLMDYDCDDTYHHGTVISTAPDVTGDDFTTVEFDCGLTEEVPTAKLLAEDDD